MAAKQRTMGSGPIDLITFAIQRKLVIRFTYHDGTRREVEPHTLGLNFAGIRLLRAWQRSGGSGTGWRLFRVDEMREVEVAPGVFFSPRPGYTRADSAMEARIDCEL